MEGILVQFIFYVFAGIALVSALFVITQNNPVRCVLFLVLTFFATAILWILVAAEFLALILVLVYVGAVMTLFLFVVMMLNIDLESIKAHLVRHLPFGLILVALLTGLLLVAVPENWYQAAVEQLSVPLAQKAVSSNMSNTEAIGMALFTDYVYAFELAAVLLLTAIVAAITLAHRGAQGSKRQNVVQQIMTEKSKRIKLVSMPSERSHQEKK